MRPHLVHAFNAALASIVAVHVTLSARTPAVALLEVSTVQVADTRVLTLIRLRRLASAWETSGLSLQVVEVIDVTRQTITESALTLKTSSNFAKFQSKFLPILCIFRTSNLLKVPVGQAVGSELFCGQ